MKIIFDYNRTIFDPETGALYPGVFELLEKLSQNNQLFLVSRNEPGRGGVLDTLGIKRFFERIEFTDNKDARMFVSLVGNEKNVIVVGDSIKGEIATGNALGLVTVRVLQGAFAGQIPKNLLERPQFEIKSLSELTRIIKLYEK